MDGPTLVDIVERELVARHIKKAEFYAATKISSATFSQWRNNIYFPSAANIKTIEEYFGISISYSVADKAAKKAPAAEGEGKDALDIELRKIWDSSDLDDRKAILEYAHFIKGRKTK